MKVVLNYFVLFFVLGPGLCNGALIDRGNGLIYSTLLDMTWIQDPMVYGEKTWDEAQSWVSNLTYGGYTDWRFPTGWSETHRNSRQSEFGRLYYGELGNEWDVVVERKSYDPGPFNIPTIQSLTICGPDCRSILFTPGPVHFWTQKTLSSYYAEGYGLTSGTYVVGEEFKDSMTSGVWAVRDGDVTPVPVPSSGMFLIVGLLVVKFGFGRKRGLF